MEPLPARRLSVICAIEENAWIVGESSRASANEKNHGPESTVSQVQPNVEPSCERRLVQEWEHIIHFAEVEADKRVQQVMRRKLVKQGRGIWSEPL